MSSSPDNNDFVDTLASAVVSYIGADTPRPRFEAFADAITDRSKMTSYLRDVEKERLLSGGSGPVVQKAAVESIGASGARPSENRDSLFFAVTELLSASDVDLSDGRRPAPASAA